MDFEIRNMRHKVRSFLPKKGVISNLNKELSNFNSKNKTILFFDLPVNGNLGDQAIVWATKRFLLNCFKNLNILEIPNDEIYSSFRWIKNNIKKIDLIICNGGGNIGTLYTPSDEARRYIFTHLNSCRKIVFPQSVYFSQDEFGRKYMLDMKSEYSKFKDLDVFFREKKSFEISNTFFFGKKFLVPDIVFSLGDSLSKFKNYSGIRKENKVLFLIRNDKERKIENDFYHKIVQYVERKGRKVIKSDTFIDKIRVTDENRLFYLRKIFREIGNSSLVVTDRLHGMIFSYLIGIPTIVLENNNHKIFSTYSTWLNNQNFVFMAKDILEFKDVFNRLNYLDMKIVKNDNLDLKFKILNTEIRRFLTNE